VTTDVELLEVEQPAPQYDLVSGNRMVAEGALRAGCRFFAGYPIAPAFEVFRVMAEELPRAGGLSISAPDDITALQYCIGASMAGYKAMSATSGPGWSLMIESVQYALMTETPLVVVVVQRLGPATGGATHGAQGDVRLVEFCTSGGYTVPVFAPSTAEDCYALTIEAFNWAERLRTPVVLLSDKEVATTTQRVNRVTLSDSAVVDRGVPFSAVGGLAKVALTGSAHDRCGHLMKPAGEALELLRALETKVTSHAHDMARFQYRPTANAEVVMISYGVTARAMKEACHHFHHTGTLPVTCLKLETLFPVPERIIRHAAASARRVLVCEENLTGQYAAVVESVLGRPVERLTKLGSMITPEEIVAAVERRGP
jgi:2-oxoglutarate ferredoxin oxidoreductase subunit alpha